MATHLGRLRFWGVRGSSPTPATSRLRYGGNTSCLSVEVAEGEHLVLDGGTGIRLLGVELAHRTAPQRFHVFLTHYHLDHVMGLPFFQPLYRKDNALVLYGPASGGGDVGAALERLIAPPYFPVAFSEVPARVEYVDGERGPFQVGDVTVESVRLHHPGGALGYRLDHGGRRRLVYATDHEHGNEAIDRGLVAFSEGADYLVYDATYQAAEYEHLRRGWGHSTWYAAVKTGLEAGVKKLFLFHHHPEHTDEDLDSLLVQARAEMPETEIAAEGMELDLGIDDPLAETVDTSRLRDFSFLSRQRVFRSLDREILDLVYSGMSEARFEQGEDLIRQGDRGNSLLVVADGEIEVSVVQDGKRHLLKHAGPGEVVGEMALLTDEPRSATVTAHTPVRAYVISAEQFRELATRVPKISALLTLLLASRLGKAKHDALTAKTFHGFRILRCLGRGGTSVVYEAEDPAGKRVALKMMSHRLLYDCVARRRFDGEAEIVESIDHPNIAKFYGRFEAFRTTFLVMEYCEGITVEDALIHCRRLDEEVARRILGQVARAVAHAHEAGIFHRDIKPSNITIARDGSVKLIDFGLAGRLDDEPLTRSLLGTPRYMAPEQMAGNLVGKGTDLFALGHVAFEMVSGRRLWQGNDFFEIAEEIARWQPPDLRAELPDVSADYRAMLRDLLRRDIDERRLDFDLVGSWAAPVDFAALDDPRGGSPGGRVA